MPAVLTLRLGFGHLEEDLVNSPVCGAVGCAQLKVTLHRDGLRGLLQRSATARCVEFNLDFMRVESEHKFIPGDRVIIDLGLDRVCMEEVEGVIFEAEPHEDCFSYRVEFLYRNRNKTHSAEIVRCLRLIEDHIRHAVV